MIYISSLLPNPAGAEAENEWIAIGNDGTAAVSLDGWVLKDDSGKMFKITNVLLDAGAEIRLGRPQTKITLGNSGDAVMLYDGAGQLVDKMSYNRAVKSEEVILRGDPSAKEVAELLEPLARFDATAIASQNISMSFWSILIAVGATFAIAAFFILKSVPRERI